MEEELKFEDPPEYVIPYQEVHIISTNKVLNTLLPMLFKKYNCQYNQPFNCHHWIISNHDKGLIDFLIEKHDIYPTYAIFSNKKIGEEYRILEFRID